MSSTKLITINSRTPVSEWVQRVQRIVDRDGCAALWAPPRAYRHQWKILNALDGLEGTIGDRGSGRILTVAPPGEGVFWRGDGRPVWAD